MKNLNWFLRKKLLLKDKTITNIAKNYLEKARNNMPHETMGKIFS